MKHEIQMELFKDRGQGLSGAVRRIITELFPLSAHIQGYDVQCHYFQGARCSEGPVQQCQSHAIYKIVFELD